MIDINKPIKSYLPDLKDQWGELVTVKNLLNHTSGIVEIGKPLAFTPGSHFQYSPGLGFYLASLIAENASKKSFRELLRGLFEKADMVESSPLISAQMSKNYYEFPRLAKAFKEENGKIIALKELREGGKLYDTSWIPGGGLISTATDLLKWNLALHQNKILSPDSYQMMTTPSITRDHPRYGKIGYGLGVQIVNQDNYQEISHGGYIDGYSSTLIYYPETKLSVVILENISYDSKDVIRAFKVHDQIRNIIRQMKGEIFSHQG